jgi:hypothetical protein
MISKFRSPNPGYLKRRFGAVAHHNDALTKRRLVFRPSAWWSRETAVADIAICTTMTTRQPFDQRIARRGGPEATAPQAVRPDVRSSRVRPAVVEPPCALPVASALYPSTAMSESMSRCASAGSFLSLVFSASSSRNRFASEASMPPNFERQCRTPHRESALSHVRHSPW